MPRTNSGDYSLPTGTIVSTGDIVLPSQHNPGLTDIAAALTNSLSRTGKGGMLADLAMGGFKITNTLPGTADTDVATYGNFLDALGSSKIGFLQGGSGAILRLLQDKIRRDVPVTPQDFGAVEWTSSTYTPGDPTTGCPDSTAALNLWNAFIFSGIPCKASWNGKFGVSSTFVFGPSSATAKIAVEVSGNPTLIALAPMDALMKQRNCKELKVQGALCLIGTGNYVYSTRTVRDGLIFEGNNISGGWQGTQYYFFQRHGARCAIGPLEYLEWYTFTSVYALGCGSGDTQLNPAYSLQSTWNTPVNSGSANSNGQRTKLKVATMPPAFVGGSLSTDPAAIIIKDGSYKSVHQIKAADYGAGTIDIFPWPLPGAPTSGTLTYVFGAGAINNGVDANLINFGEVSGIHCGFALQATALYPGKHPSVTAQACAIGIGFGPGTDIVCDGGGVGDAYFEQNCEFEFVAFTPAPPDVPSAKFYIDSVHEYNLDKWTALMAHDGTNSRAQLGLAGFDFPFPIPAWEKFTGAPAQGFADVGIHQGQYEVNWSDWDNPLVRLSAFDPKVWRNRGRNARVMTFTGSGPNAAVTGTVTINASMIAGTLINGGGGVVFSNLKGPLSLLIMADPATGNFTAVRLTATPAAAVADPTGGATIDTEARAVIGAIIDRLEGLGLLNP